MEQRQEQNEKMTGVLNKTLQGLAENVTLIATSVQVMQQQVSALLDERKWILRIALGALIIAIVRLVFIHGGDLK